MALVIENTLYSNLPEIRGVLDNVLENIKDIITDEDILFDTKLILDELIINGVRHGNTFESDKKVYVSVIVEDAKITIEVIDEGEGFDYDREAYDPLELSIGGRGLRIVDGLSDEFYVEKNKATSIKYLKQRIIN